MRDQYLNLAEAVLRLPDVPQPMPAEPASTAVPPTDFRQWFTRVTRQYASGLRPTHGPVIGAIEPGEKP